MKPLRILIVSRKVLYIAVCAALVLLAALTAVVWLSYRQAGSFVDPGSGIIVVDAGHGGVDGGTNTGGILEKDINLAIAVKLKEALEREGFRVVMTREEDRSLDGLNRSSRSRHRRDLNARVHMINTSNAQLFISVHVNCYNKNPSVDGSVVFYNNKYRQNRLLAESIQSGLNAVMVDGTLRTSHTPKTGDFYILNQSNVPGVIVETAFLSNQQERKLLLQDAFHGQLAQAITNGVLGYINNES